jgi:DNA-binding transcriptional MerR regulator
MRLPIDNADAPLYTVGQVATMLGVQPAFLRRLDSEDLVSPERSDGGQRRYTRSEIDQIHRVSELAGEGLTLAGIRRLLALEAEVAQLKREVARLSPAGTPGRPGEPRSSKT